MNVSQLQVSGWDISKSQTHAVRTKLAPFLLYHGKVKNLIKINERQNRILLHPRIGSSQALPKDAFEFCVRHEAEECTHILENFPPVLIDQLWTILFFSSSKSSPPLLSGLPHNWRQVMSNFYPAQLEIDGFRYDTVEHYFQGQKALASSKPEMAIWFSSQCLGREAIESDPAAAKRAGSRKAYQQHGAILNIEQWEAQRVDCMRRAIEHRFDQDDLFKQILDSTKKMKLLHFERSGARSFWGGNFSRQTGEAVGDNRLGKLMMEIRDQKL